MGSATLGLRTWSVLSGHQLSEFITVQSGGPTPYTGHHHAGHGNVFMGLAALPSGDAVSPSVSTHTLTDLHVALWVVWTQREGGCWGFYWGQIRNQ